MILTFFNLIYESLPVFAIFFLTGDMPANSNGCSKILFFPFLQSTLQSHQKGDLF